jgi:hypothetical protein
MNCKRCTSPIPAHVERCVVCGEDVGFPNVRAAETADEEAALQRRLAAARTAATARGAIGVLNDFGAAVKNSRAVLARPLGDLDALAKGKNVLYISFHSQVRAGSRIPEDNDWDRGRAAAESTIHPIYFERISYTALSLDGFGVLWWGDYSITLKEIHIASRTTVFEENPFIFCQRHRVIAGKRPPLGYRATWQKRNELAMAKLADKLKATTAPKDFPSILLNEATSREDADFVECHIYGSVHPTSIERVIGPRPKGGPDLVLWKSVSNALRKAGVIVEEV